MPAENIDYQVIITSSSNPESKELKVTAKLKTYRRSAPGQLMNLVKLFTKTRFCLQFILILIGQFCRFLATAQMQIF